MHSHHDGEAWGLAIIEEQNKFITSCDDNKLLMYDMTSRRCVQRGLVHVSKEGEPPTVRDPKQVKSARHGGASTTSIEPPDKQSRALAWNKTLMHLAVANNLGQVSIRKVTFEKGSDLNTIVATLNDSKEWIECMNYDPSN